MWAHQIIEYANVEKVTKIITESQHFYFGDIRSCLESVGIKPGFTPYFPIKLSFDKMLYMLIYDEHKLALQIVKQNEDYISLKVWVYINNIWNYSNACIDVELKSGNYASYRGSTRIKHNDGADMIVIVFCVLSNILMCKNIYTEKINPPEKLNKRRRRKNRQELLSYHVLNVNPLSNKKSNNNSENQGGHNRLHLCRGHFKMFTEEKPLLGKHIGLYWWEPAARGQNKNGIVLKDYNVKGG